MLRDLPPEHAALLEALLQERNLLVTLAERRAERVQRLHEASSALLRTLDPAELEREVAAQLLRLIPADGVVVSGPPAATGTSPIAKVHLTIDGVARLEDVELVAPVMAEVLRTGRSARIAGRGDVSGAAMAVPVMQGFRLVGLIAAYSRYAATFGDEDMDASQTLAAHAATALGNAAHYARSERERRQSDALASLAQALGAASRLPDVMRLALRHAIALFGVEGADIALRRDDFLQVVSAEGVSRALPGVFLPMNASLSGRAAREARPIIVNDAAGDPETFEPARRLVLIQRKVAAPLISAGEVIGVLSLINRERPFDADDARMLTQFASQVAVAIVNARLYEEAAEAQREITAAFEAIGDGIVVLDADARIVRHNARFLEMAGLPGADGARGRGFYDAVLHVPREVTESCAVGQAILGGRPARAQLRSAWNGRVLNILAAPHPAGGAVVSVDDVTEFHLLAERHRLVVDNITDAILVTSADGEVEFANPAAQRLFGAAVVLVGARIGALVPASEATVWAEAIGRSRRGESARLDGTIGRAEPDRRQVSVSLAPLVDENRVSHLVISLRDVTDEADARDELLAANARYRDLVEMAADAIITLSVTGSFTSVNPAVETLTGFARDAMLGRSFASFVEPAESTETDAAFAAAVGGALRRFEMHLVRADGARRLIAIALSPMRRAGVVVGVLATARDVTEDREQGAALVRAEARFTRLVEAAEDAIVCVDEEGNFTAVNKAFETVSGKPREALLGRHFMDAVDESERPTLWQGFAAALTGEREHRTIRFTRPNGVAGHATLVTAPIIEHGRVTGVLGIARDVTEERRLLDQAIRQDRMVAMGELVGGVAHEVNSPLTSILTCAHVLARGGVSTDEAAQALGTITQEAKRAARIVGKLLAFGRSGQPERVPSDVNQALRDTIDLRRYALRMQDVALSVSLMSDPPLVLADPFQLQQVFINLLSNAEQAVAHQAGERRITVTSAVRGDSYVATISDNGSGIAPEALPHIFNPFFTTKPRGAGTGLGLSISYGIVREHRGALRARSEPGQGATFEVELPIHPAAT